MKRKLLSLLVLLITAATGAWAQYVDYDINVNFNPYYNPVETHFNCMIMSMDPGAEIKGTLDLSVDGVSKGSFDVNGEMVDGFIAPPIDAGDHTYKAVFHPEGGGSFNRSGGFTINKADADINYYGSTSINLGVGESTELEVYLFPDEAGELSYSSSDPSVASITKGYGYSYTIQANAAGTATITFSFAGNTNYDEAEDKTITVTVLPAPIDVTTNEGATGQYWATFYSNAMNYQAPEGTQVFKVNLTGTAIEMTEITDRIVKSGQGVVLKKTTSGSITMTPTSSNSSDDYSGNSLVGTMTSITNPGNAYVLNYKAATGAGFYKLSASGTIGANKAYLTYSGSLAPEFFGFDGNTTSINEVRGKMEDVSGEYYDLQGRRVSQPTKGLYIVNGKKVFINK